MLKQRIITAAILIPVTLIVLFYFPPIPFCLATAALALAAAWEWSNLMEVKQKSWRVIYVLFTAMVFVDALYVPAPVILACAFIWWLLALVLVIKYPRFSHFWCKGVFWRGVMGLFVLTPCWAALNFIRNQSDGIYAMLFLFILIWGADTVAYFVGRKWGKTKLSPRVSPNKSVEGALGALAFCTVVALIVLWLGDIPVRFWLAGIFLASLTAIFSIVGDLFESMLKRQAGLKDSGTLLPGHGGLLDRIDSLTAAAPVFSFGIMLLGLLLN